MAEQKWKEVEGGGDMAEMWTYREEGDEISGRYIGSKDNIGPNKSMVYLLEQQNGEVMGVWGGTVIDGKMKKIAVGKMVRVVYQGQMKSKRGNKYNDFKVYEGVDYPSDKIN